MKEITSEIAHELNYNDQIFDDDGSDHKVSEKEVKVWLLWVTNHSDHTFCAL